MNRFLPAGLVAVVGLSVVSDLSCRAADQPALPDEFAITDSIVLTDEDELYVSPSARFFKLPDEKRLTLASEFAYGVTDRWEVTAELPYEFRNPSTGRSVNGIGDVELSARYGVLDFRKNPFALDLGVRLELPTGSRAKDLGEGRVAVEPNFTASQWLGRLNVQFNFAWHRAVSHAGRVPENEYDYNVALVWPVHEVFVVLEGNGATDHRQTKYYVTPELVWKATEHFQLLMAAPVGVTRAAGDYSVVVGCTIEFENLFGRSPEKP